MIRKLQVWSTFLPHYLFL